MLPRPSPAMSAVFDELASDASSPYLDVTLAQQYKPRVRHTGVSARPKPYQLHRDQQMDPVLSRSCSIFLLVLLLALQLVSIENRKFKSRKS